MDIKGSLSHLSLYRGFQIILALLVLIAVQSEAIESKQPALKFIFETNNKWTVQSNTALSPGDRHYIFEQDKGIDILVTQDQEDKLTELKKIGEELFVAQIMKGKNLIAGLVSDVPIALKEKKFENYENGKVLTLHVQQIIGGKKTDTIEKYFIFPGFTATSFLRWKENVDKNKLEFARHDFEKIKFKVERAE